jgi:hypothetical protein
MKIRFMTLSACLIASTLAYSQVGISKKENSSFLPHPESSLHLDGSNVEGKALGIVLPKVDDKSQLPLANNSEDGYADDPTLKGMLLFNKETTSVDVYTGEFWEEDKNRFTDPRTKQSRFLGKGDGTDQQSVVCVLILACGRNRMLSFSHAVDGQDSYNNLNIVVEDLTHKYGAINYTDPNAKFIIKEAGTYQIRINLPTYIAGVASLTEGASYQIYASKKDENGDPKEVLLSSVVPNFPGILGIGGGSRVGIGITTTISLAEDDFIYTMIHSPGVTVTVGSELLAWDKDLFNPKEIIFTKLD